MIKVLVVLEQTSGKLIGHATSLGEPVSVLVVSESGLIVSDHCDFLRQKDSFDEFVWDSLVKFGKQIHGRVVSRVSKWLSK